MVLGDGLGGPPGLSQRPHEQLPQRLAQGVAAGQAAQLRGHRLGVARRQSQPGALLHRGQVLLGQAGNHVPVQGRRAHVGQGLAAPQADRLVQPGQRARRRSPRVLDQLAEPPEIDLGGFDVEQVAVTGGHHQAGQQTAQPRHHGLQPGPGPFRPVIVVPDQLGQPRAADRPAGGQGQHRQQHRGPAARQRDGRAVTSPLKRPQHPDPQARIAGHHRPVPVCNPRYAVTLTETADYRKKGTSGPGRQRAAPRGVARGGRVAVVSPA